VTLRKGAAKGLRPIQNRGSYEEIQFQNLYVFLARPYFSFAGLVRGNTVSLSYWACCSLDQLDITGSGKGGVGSSSHPDGDRFPHRESVSSVEIQLESFSKLSPDEKEGLPAQEGIAGINLSILCRADRDID